MNLFFAEFNNEFAILNVHESQHCIKVLRYRIGDHIWVTDGKGKALQGEIIEIEHQQVKVLLSATVYSGAAPGPYTLFMAPTKHIDRTEWAVEKATELGVKHIGFFTSRYSERRHLNLKRIQLIIDAAMKQSQRTLKPSISELQPFENLLQQYSGSAFGIAHCLMGSKININTWVKQKHTHYTLCIGPEGDFSEQEITQARQTGISEIVLGEARLRTETAVIYACSVLHALTA